ncbi:MAG: 16S rRNA (guanine(527)-N(7))-methyltransferase RsmG [Pirellulales bacterium]
MNDESQARGDAGLAEALARHQIELPADRVEMLERYCGLLWEINKSLNLTRHTDYEKFVSRDLVDTMMIEKQIGPDERVLDVGTGGGVPGIVLAILRPDLEVTLAESVGKKAKAVGEIVAGLSHAKSAGLSIAVHHGRAEDLLGARAFDTLVARAVAPLEKLLTWFQPHWGAFDRLLVVKGPAWVEERKKSRERHLLDDLQLRKLATWPLPGSESESVLLEIKPKE